MKRLLFLLGTVLLMGACEVDPDLDELDDKLVVYTDYDAETDFGEFRTYFMPDSILDYSSGSSKYWDKEKTMQIMDAVEAQMNDRGYYRYLDLADKEKADVGIQISYLSQTNHVITGDYWGGWWDYNYWGPWWGGWYYPAGLAYTYSTNSMVLEMVDLTHKERSVKLPIVWYAQASGYRYNGKYNMVALVEAVNQAFEQSEYLHRTIK